MPSYVSLLRVLTLVGVCMVVEGCLDEPPSQSAEEKEETHECRVVAQPLTDRGGWVLDWSAVELSITGAPVDSYSDFRGLGYLWLTPTQPESEGWYCSGAYEVASITSVNLEELGGVHTYSLQDEAAQGTHLAALLFAEEPLSVALGSVQSDSTATTLSFPNGGE